MSEDKDQEIEQSVTPLLKTTAPSLLVLGELWQRIKRTAVQLTTDRVVGVDLTPSSLTMVELENLGRPVLRKWATHAIERAVTVEHEENHVRSGLSEFVRQYRLDRARVAVGISGPGICVKVVSIPRMSSEELKAHLAWDIDHYLPYGPDEIYWDAQIQPETNETRSKGAMSVLLAAAKKELVDGRIALLAEAGLHPEVLDVDGLTLGHLWDRVCSHSVPGDGAALWVNYDPFRLTMTVFDRQQIVAIRDAVFDPPSLDSTWGAPIQERTPLNADRDMCDPSSDQSLNLARENIVSELRRTMRYSESGESPIAVSRILLSGGGPDFDVLSHELRATFDLEVQVIDPFRYLEIVPSTMDEISTAKSTGAAIATGLALRLIAA